MALLDTTRTSYAADTTGLISSLVARYVAWSDTRKTRLALESLSDHELADIGLHRGDIEDVVAGAR